MRLDRNKDGTQKYALVKMRVVQEIKRADPQGAGKDVESALATLAIAGVLDRSGVGDDGEFFVIRLKDRHAGPALEAYAKSAGTYDYELGVDVAELMARADGHPNRKDPD
jgi:hypothetical protein